MIFEKIFDKKLKDTDPKIIAWQRKTTKDLNTPLLYFYPQPGESLKNKKYFAVKDYERALFYNKGELIGILGGGLYKIEKKARIKGTEIVWIDISINEIFWGIPIKNGILTKDGFNIGLHGDLKFRINNVKTFYNDVVAGKKEWTLQDLKEWINGLLHTSLRDIFKHYNLKDIILEDRERIINLVTSKVTEEFLQYGLELESFNIIGFKTPFEEQRFLEEEKFKTITIARANKESFKGVIERKNFLQARIDDLYAKIKELQDQLLKDEINQDTYEKKKQQIQKFIDEAQAELKRINETISRN
ncbi:MAG: SPFH domain-containing protein [Promethearchaeota archaeon]